MRTALKLAILAAGAVVAAPAMADEGPAAPAAGVAMPAPQAEPATEGRKAGDWLVRARAILVAPNESSGAITGIAGSEVGLGNSVMPEVDFTYMFTKNIGAELILGTTHHDISGRGTVSALGKVGKTWVLPPTLTLQYHFMPEGKIHPYVGAGVNYTLFYSNDTTNSLTNALGGKTDLKLDDSFGWALQGGVDFDINKKLFINADIKYIDMNTKARLTTGNTLRTVNVDVNPIVAAIGVGFRF